MRSPVARSSMACLVAILWLVQDAPAAKKWRVKPECTLIENKANDGDSFHVRVNRRHYIFRLYWVDAPETDLSTPERVAEQGQYFGLSNEETVRVGKMATRFAEEFLSEPFTVHTKFADAMGRSQRDRDYAIIEKDGTYLHMELVRNGLARIHGLQHVSDEMPDQKTMLSRLKYAEQEAKKEGLGAWGLRGGGSPASGLLPSAVTLSRSVAVLDPQNPSRKLGVLRSGSRVEIIEAHTPTLIRVRFSVGDGTREGLCQRASLGI